MIRRYDKRYPNTIFSNPDRMWSDAEIVTAGCLYVQRRGATVRSLAEQLGISKSTLHKYLTSVLPEICAPLAAVVARKMSIMKVFPKNGTLKVGQPQELYSRELQRKWLLLSRRQSLQRPFVRARCLSNSALKCSNS